jgi:catechol 2,3-dioxygenase-like lactoylglutathione lyase family enzyme
VIDHTGLNVSDFRKSKAFYVAALAPLGYQVMMELPAAMVPQGAMGMGELAR